MRLTQIVTLELDVRTLSDRELIEISRAIDSESIRRENKSHELDSVEVARAVDGDVLRAVQYHRTRTGSGFKQALLFVENYLKRVKETRLARDTEIDK
jgi:hypothetical protein